MLYAPRQHHRLRAEVRPPPVVLHYLCCGCVYGSAWEASTRCVLRCAGGMGRVGRLSCGSAQRALTCAWLHSQRPDGLAARCVLGRCAVRTCLRGLRALAATTLCTCAAPMSTVPPRRPRWGGAHTCLCGVCTCLCGLRVQGATMCRRAACTPAIIRTLCNPGVWHAACRVRYLLHLAKPSMQLLSHFCQALEEGLTCQQICDKYHAIHKVRLAFLLHLLGLVAVD